MRFTIKNRVKSIKFDPKILLNLFNAIMPFLLVIGTAAGLALALHGFFYNSDFFIVRDIKLVGARASDINLPSEELARTVRNRHIKDIDLNAFYQKLMQLTPQIERATVSRAYPNRILIRVVPRRPIAQINGSNCYLVDRDGVVFSAASGAPANGFPVIKGLRENIAAYKGKRCDSRQLRRALSLISVLAESRFSQEHPVTIIDASDESNMLFFLEGGIEVRMGASDFAKRIDSLKATLKEARVDLNKVKYIDARFSDVVIGPR